MNMEEKIKYWDEDIDRQEFLKKAYEGLSNYLEGRKYSYSSKKNDKRRDQVKEALKDIINRGITGYSENQTHISNAEGLDLNDNKWFNPYGEASTYIGKVLKSLSGKPKEEPKEETKQKFTNQFMTDSFHTSLSNSNFGGQTGALNALWNSRDELVNGVRGITNRRRLLINELKNWGDNLNPDDYDFEESPYQNFDDFNQRRLNAIAALESSSTITPQVRDTLLKLGLNPDTYFDNGSNDNSGYVDEQGNPLTNSQYRAYLEQQEILKQQQQEALKQQQESVLKEIHKKHEQFQKQQIQEIRNNIINYNRIFGYGSDNTWNVSNFASEGKLNSIKHLPLYMTKEFQNINQQYLNNNSPKVRGAYKLAFENNYLQDVTDEAWNVLSKGKKFQQGFTYDSKNRLIPSPSHYGQYRRGDFKMFKGIDNLIYDSRYQKLYLLDKEEPKDAVEQAKQRLEKSKSEYSTQHYRGPRMTIHKLGGQLNRQRINNYKRIIK